MFDFLKKKKAEEIKPSLPVPERSVWSRIANAFPVSNKKTQVDPFAPYQPIAGVLPSDKTPEAMAMDGGVPYQTFSQGLEESFGMFFPGFQYLGVLAQKPEYRKMVETIAEEMTRKWVKLDSSGDDDKSERIGRLEKALEKYRVQEVVRKMIENDGYYGRGQVYIDLTLPKSKTLVSMDDVELATELTLTPEKIPKGSLVGFRNIEPFWTYPYQYDSNQPLSRYFYKPKSWYVMGKEVSASRLLTLVSRPVPDIYKPSYAFAGLSLSQIAEPYVNNWLSARDSIRDIIKSYSITGIKLDLGTLVSGRESGDVLNRMDGFTLGRDNRGLAVLDKNEDFFQFNTPLSGLDALQSQAKENMSFVSSIPLVKLLGITPSGLNASSEGEIRVFYDWIFAKQEADVRDNLKKMIDIIQLSEFGDIDDSITFIFNPLYQMSDKEIAEIREIDSRTDNNRIEGGVLSARDVRMHVSQDPSNPYNGIDPDDIEDNGLFEDEEEAVNA